MQEGGGWGVVDVRGRIMGSKWRSGGGNRGVCLLLVTPPAMCSPSEEARVLLVSGVCCCALLMVVWPFCGVALLWCGLLVCL